MIIWDNFKNLHYSLNRNYFTSNKVGFSKLLLCLQALVKQSSKNSTAKLVGGIFDEKCSLKICLKCLETKKQKKLTSDQWYEFKLL